MLDIVPVSLKEANAFVERYHRHHKPVVGHKFSIGATDGETIVGVAIVGRPVSRWKSHAAAPMAHAMLALFCTAQLGEPLKLWDIRK